MDIIEAKKIIETCRELNSVHVFKKLTENTPSWKNFIDHLHYEFNHEDTQVGAGSLEETMIGGVCLRNNFYMSVRNPQGFGFEYLDDVVDFWDKAFEEPGHAVSAFINFVGNEKPISLHTDRRDTLYWQCQGVVEWLIAENHESPPTSYFLEPGDFIFVPKGLLHSVVTESPRASITLSYKTDPYESYYEDLEGM